MKLIGLNTTQLHFHILSHVVLIWTVAYKPTLNIEWQLSPYTAIVTADRSCHNKHSIWGDGD